MSAQTEAIEKTSVFPWIPEAEETFATFGRAAGNVRDACESAVKVRPRNANKVLKREEAHWPPAASENFPTLGPLGKKHSFTFVKNLKYSEGLGAGVWTSLLCLKLPNSELPWQFRSYQEVNGSPDEWRVLPITSGN